MHCQAGATRDKSNVHYCRYTVTELKGGKYEKVENGKSSLYQTKKIEMTEAIMRLITLILVPEAEPA